MCSGHATAQRIACDGSKWLAGTTCAPGELCDSTSGECAKVVPECVAAAPGAVACRGDQLLTCGVDLVTASEGETCAGLCKDGVCQTPICGDEKLEPGEECDDGKRTSGGCGADCKAICGDKIVLAGYEQCDFGDVVRGDGCSADCNWEPTALSLGDTGTCALSFAGDVKCWGENDNGQLGLGDTRPRGVKPGEVAELAAIQLGKGRRATAISSGRGSNCALLDNGSVKCWGDNSVGQLGIGDVPSRGGQPDQMGDSLPSISLLGNLPATSISSGALHACAVVNGSVQCWGSGVFGQLGQGDVSTHPQPVAVYDFGKVTSVAVSAGGAFSCEVLQGGSSFICWGDNRDGQLCNGYDSYAIGDTSGEMSQLLKLALGAATVKAIAPGAASVCLLLSDGSVKCWGRGDSGQLGTEDPDPHGTIPYTFVGLLPIPLGAGRKATALTAGALHVCVLLDDATIKCWGDNKYGQLGIGRNTPTVGDTPGTMGDNLKVVDLGAGRTAKQVVAGENHTCALLDNGTIKCWGRNAEGELGLGDTDNRGVAANQMGDKLTSVPLNF